MVSRSEIKYIQSLSARKHRLTNGCYLAEGNHLAGEALAFARSSILKIFALPHWISNQNKYLEGLQVVEISAAEMKKLSQLTTATDVLLVIKLPSPDVHPIAGNKWVLMLDGVQDPGNTGSLIRIADWFGIETIVLGSGSADAFQPKTVQATMGSIFRVNVLQQPIADLLKHYSGNVYGAMMQGNSIWQTATYEPGPIIIGSEGSGISKEVEQCVSHQITIPKIGKAESLNAAVAAGIICSHLCKPI